MIVCNNIKAVDHPLTVLVTGAGSVYGMAVVTALHQSVLPVRIIAIDINPYAPGLYMADEGFLAPSVTAAQRYAAFVEGLCQKYQIRAIFIGSETELSFYAKKKKALEQLTDAKIFVSSPKVIKICTDKWLTTEYLTQKGFLTPRSMCYPEDKSGLHAYVKNTGFPLIVKPRLGNGSKGVALVKNRRQLYDVIEGRQNCLIQEYISGEEQEFTVGICCDHRSEVIAKIALRRYLRDGVTVAAVADDYDAIADYGASVAGALKAYGAINIQLRLRDGKPVIFDINPRFSSSTGMRLLLGINEPESLLRSEVLGQKVIPKQAKKGLLLRQYADCYYPLERLKQVQDGL